VSAPSVQQLDWERDLPDHQDLLPRHGEVLKQIADLTPARPDQLSGDGPVDWREYCGPVRGSNSVGCGTALACVALVQLLERRATGQFCDPCARFLSYVTRRMLHRGGDGGLSLRATLKAMVRFGVPPEAYWPSEAAELGGEPEPFLFGFARDYASICYVRLDPRGGSGAQTLRAVKEFLGAGFPSVFGFAVTSAIPEGPEVPYPAAFDKVVGGCAAVALGYDDARRIGSTKGALLICPSWGPQWGESGYGWLPYRYIEEQLAVDFWTLLKPAWIASGEFFRPNLDLGSA
jgi:hypothetical protein